MIVPLGFLAVAVVYSWLVVQGDTDVGELEDSEIFVRPVLDSGLKRERAEA